jgi:hypothetical protein
MRHHWSRPFTNKRSRRLEALRRMSVFVPSISFAAKCHDIFCGPGAPASSESQRKVLFQVDVFPDGLRARFDQRFRRAEYELSNQSWKTW